MIKVLSSQQIQFCEKEEKENKGVEFTCGGDLENVSLDGGLKRVSKPVTLFEIDCKRKEKIW